MKESAKTKLFTAHAVIGGLIALGAATAVIAVPLAVLKHTNNPVVQKATTLTSTAIEQPTAIPVGNFNDGSINTLAGTHNFNYGKDGNALVVQESKSNNTVTLTAPTIKSYFQVNNGSIFYQWFVYSQTNSSVKSTLPTGYVGAYKLLGLAQASTQSNPIQLGWSLVSTNTSQVTTSVNFGVSTPSNSSSSSSSSSSSTSNSKKVTDSKTTKDSATTPATKSAKTGGALSLVGMSTSIPLYQQNTQSIVISTNAISGDAGTFYVYCVFYTMSATTNNAVIGVSNTVKIVTSEAN